MNIGTAKPSPEKLAAVPHHLIDVVEPSEPFSVSRFLELTESAITDITAKGKPVIAVGGTAMYIKALLHGIFDGPGTDDSIRESLKSRIDSEGLANLHKELAKIDPESASRIHPNDAKRVIRALEVFQLTGKPISSFQKQFDQPGNTHQWTIIGLRRDKTDASHRINTRVKRMIEQGLVDEVKSLLAEQKPLSQQAACAIGYAEIIEHLTGKISLEDAIELIKKNSRQLAKAQRTWFKTFRNVNWIEVASDDTTERIIPKALEITQTG